MSTTRLLEARSLRRGSRDVPWLIRLFMLAMRGQYLSEECKSAYETALLGPSDAAIGGTVTLSKIAMPESDNSRDREAIERAVRDVAAGWRGASANLASIESPEVVRDLHEDLIDELARHADLLESGNAKAQAGPGAADLASIGRDAYVTFDCIFAQIELELDSVFG